jgi:hypothetical protein
MPYPKDKWWSILRRTSNRSPSGNLRSHLGTAVADEVEPAGAHERIERPGAELQESPILT